MSEFNEYTEYYDYEKGQYAPGNSEEKPNANKGVLCSRYGCQEPSLAKRAEQEALEIASLVEDQGDENAAFLAKRAEQEALEIASLVEDQSDENAASLAKRDEKGTANTNAQLNVTSVSAKATARFVPMARVEATMQPEKQERAVANNNINLKMFKQNER